MGDYDVWEPISLVTTAEEVHRRLKQAILDGDLTPGSRLIEHVLAEKLGVSRTPVREALKAMMLEGLVAVDGRRGVRVASLSIENVTHAYTVRQSLEGLAAQLAASHQRPDLLHQLSQALQRMEHPQGDAEAFDRAHSQFHDTLAEMSGNPFLVQALRALEGFRTRMVTLDWVTQKRVATSVPEHRAILEAIESRDGTLAKRRAEEHVARTRQGLIQRLRGALEDEPSTEREV